MSKKKKKDDFIEEDMFEIKLNPALQPLWIDYLDPSIRDDDIILVRLATSLPEGIYEQARIVTNKEKMTNYIKDICALLDYYPEKPADDSST